MATQPDKVVVKRVDEALDALTRLSQSRLNDAIVRIERDIQRRLGRLESVRTQRPKTRLKTAVEMHKYMTTLFVTLYDKEALRHVRRYPRMNTLVEEVYASLGKGDATFNATTKLTLRGLQRQDFQLHKSLSKEAKDRIIKAVYGTVLGLGDIELLSVEIAGALVGHVDARGRPLSSYSATYAQDQIMQYHATANLALGKQAGAKRWGYVGDLVDKSRDFCENHWEEVKLTQEWVDIGMNQNWQGKSCNDIFICRGGYNCRHHFQAVFT